jgi:endonuclease/exonuclease/phosphatase family metal-dependent hydrolase
MTWNIGANSIFADPGPRGYKGSDPDRPSRFRRLLTAVNPDVVCLQEVFAPRNAADVARILDDALPLPGGDRWHGHGQPDVVIASRFPIVMRDAKTEDWGGGVPRTHAMGLLELPARIAGGNLYVLCAHAQARSEPKDVKARQEHADAIAAWLRDLRAPGGTGLPDRTAIVLAGDWNAYKTDPARHIDTLLTGAIANHARFGPGRPPDWDDSPLMDARPVHNGSGKATHTFGDGSTRPFPPAELDRVLFTDSVLRMLGGFVLDTTSLSPADLSRFALGADDVLLNTSTRAFDHLPVVIDVSFR